MPVKMTDFRWGNKPVHLENTSLSRSPSMIRHPLDCLTHMSHLKLHLVVGSNINFSGNFLKFDLPF